VTSGDFDAQLDPVSPYTCDRCGTKDRVVRLFENGSAARLGDDWRLMPMHPACFRQWQGEVDLGLRQPHAGTVERDFGWWTLPTGQRARLSWRRRDGQLYLHRPDRGNQPLLVLDDAQVDHLLEGWSGAHGDLAWLARRLALAGAAL
jgi:hypothetical protein